MSTDFKGRVAMVTGTGGGLGRCHTPALAARGAKVRLLPGGRIHLVVAAKLLVEGGILRRQCASLFKKYL